MENILIRLLEQSPATVAVIVVVAWFLRAMKDYNASWHEFIKKENEHMRAAVAAQTTALNALTGRLMSMERELVKHDTAMRARSGILNGKKKGNRKRADE